MNRERKIALCLLSIGLVVAVGTGADAQQRLLDLRQKNFDMWCQEERHLPPERCDRRLPEDDAAYQQYVDTVERYETQMLNRQALERHLERTILHADPFERPIGTSPHAPERPQ